MLNLWLLIFDHQIKYIDLEYNFQNNLVGFVLILD